MQALERSRAKAESARVAAALATKAVHSLEVEIPKAELEMNAKAERAKDLKGRLQELKDATKVGMSRKKVLPVIATWLARVFQILSLMKGVTLTASSMSSHVKFDS